MDHPVVNVSWNDAVSFCEWLTGKERSAGRISKDQRYRLPTEAEWEYACRGGSKVSTLFSFGNEVDDLVRYGNVGDLTALKYFGSENSGNYHPKEDGAVFTSKVGSYPPNAFGLYDMHGNVYEWCADWIGEYPSEAVKDPTGATSGTNRVIRGGSWTEPVGFCRSAFRGSCTPDDRGCGLGFRVAVGR
jgi:formylglycine-generating enzyme required for sulfatase activity